MKIEVSCPDCGKILSVEQSASGEMFCPACMTRIVLDGSATRDPVVETPRSPPAAPTAPPAVQTVSPAPAAPPAAQAPAPPSTTPTADAPAPATVAASEEIEEVVCPRCNLHFMPRERPPDVNFEPKKTVLVVEELEYFRNIARDALSPMFEVKTAAGREEAHEILTQGGIELIVLDLALGGDDGGRQLLTELDPKPCPILIFTADDKSEMYGELWEQLSVLGADELVVKGMHAAESLARKAGILLGTPVDEENPIR